MAYKQLSQLNFDVKAAAGACLVQAQNVVGAGGGPYSATAAANGTRFRHSGGKLPRDASVVVWFDHWGTYQDYRNGQFRYENWGHVVIWWPKAFNNAGGFYSSPRSGYGGEWFRTIADIEREFNSTYRFWSEDINGVRVSAPVEVKPPAKPAAKPVPKPKPKPAPITEEDDEMAEQGHAYVRDAATKGQGSIYLIRNADGKKRKMSKAEWNARRASLNPAVADISAADLKAIPNA